MIYHITSPLLWQSALVKGFFETGSLHTEGFIHCCTDIQVSGVIERYYKNNFDLLLLHVDECKLVSSLRYELAPSVNQLFPHIYGYINLDAVQNIIPLVQK